MAFCDLALELMLALIYSVGQSRHKPFQIPEEETETSPFNKRNIKEFADRVWNHQGHSTSNKLHFFQCLYCIQPLIRPTHPIMISGSDTRPRILPKSGTDETPTLGSLFDCGSFWSKDQSTTETSYVTCNIKWWIRHRLTSIIASSCQFWNTARAILSW